MNIEYIEKVIDLSKKAMSNGDVPVGALIVKNGEIIAESYNTRELNQDVLGHAEVNAIRIAQTKLNNWNLNGCDLYVSLKPCSMCVEIIKQARVSKVYYLSDKLENKKEYDSVDLIKFDQDEYSEKYIKILSEFFQDLRAKK